MTCWNTTSSREDALPAVTRDQSSGKPRCQTCQLLGTVGGGISLPRTCLCVHALLLGLTFPGGQAGIKPVVQAMKHMATLGQTRKASERVWPDDSAVPWDSC